MNQAIPSARSSSLVIPGLPPGLTVNFVIGLAILLGGALRLVFVARVDFPYNDGGLFYTLVNELVANGFHLPAFSAYNATHLPVVYPPLAFYLAGLINLLFRVPVVELQRWLPLFFSLLTIPAFAWLSIAILKNSSAAALATLAFALLPNSTDRLLMGGGLTRAPGFFFALIALACIYRLFESDSDSSHWRRLLLAILFSALTVLTHPVYAWFVVCSSAVFLLYSRPKRRNLGRALIVAAGVLLVSAPWWLSMLHTHGLGPVLVAFQSRNLSNLAGPLLSILQLSTFDFSREFFLEILGVLSLVGLVFSLFERKTFWLVWLLVIFIFERTSPVALAVVPLAMLSGLASARLLGASQPAWESPYRRRFIQIGFTILVFYCLFSSYLSFAPQVLTPAVRRSMEWTGQNSAPQSRYLVLTANPWWDDPLTEWFPALADRTSLTTVQGYEWTSPSQFADRVSRYDAVRDCLQSIRVACLAQWSAGQGTTFDYIFIPVLPPARGQAALEDTPLVQALRQSPAYLLVSEQAGALIFKPAAGN
jgi:hypothetical protein